jgi:hypothetical protein
MANNRFERVDRLKAVEREFRVVSNALEQLEIALRDGRLVLPDQTTARDLDAARRRLEDTFLIRVWAEFETAVRSYHACLTHDTNLGIRAIDLVNTIGAASTGRAFSMARREQVHEVRRYRNSLVHERDDPTPPVAISEATRRLNSFLGAKLPEQWG